VAIAEALSVFYQNECFDSAFSNWRRHFYWVSQKRKGILLYRNWYKFESSLKLILRGGITISELTISAAVLIMPT
jgi:hypothetical protein